MAFPVARGFPRHSSGINRFHSPPQPELIVPVLTAASEVGMMTPGYVWIATEGVVAELENLPELSTEGIIGTRVFVPPNPQLSEFERAWQADGDGNATTSGGAFDTTTLYLAFYLRFPLPYRPLHPRAPPPQLPNPQQRPSSCRQRQRHNMPVRSPCSLSLHVTCPVPLPHGTKLMAAVTRMTIDGVTGRQGSCIAVPHRSWRLSYAQQLTGSQGGERAVHVVSCGALDRGFLHCIDSALDAQGDRIFTSFEIVNAVNDRLCSIGYWTRESGLTSSLEPSSTSKDSGQSVLAGVIWPGGVSFDFTQFVQKATNDTITGFCVEVFWAAVGLLPYTLGYEFVPFGVGNQSLSYTDMLRLVANKGKLPYTLDYEFVPFGVGNPSLCYTDMLRLVAERRSKQGVM
ncbi:unnamed protein product [Closterium sp. Yama58-4]|nr:unnamed protein product [Closterium sp. Yama58-4]